MSSTLGRAEPDLMQTAGTARRNGFLVVCLLAGCAATQPLVPYTTVGDAVPTALVAGPPDPSQGRAIIAGRDGNCLLCHSIPESWQPFMGNIGPSLSGVGRRLSAAQLRLRIIDAAVLNRETVMPPYYRTDGLTNVAVQFSGKPILNAQQIEDVVAYLGTLRQ